MNSMPTNIQHTLDEIKAGQQALMAISKKHLELYAEQLAKTNELNDNLFQLQKQNFITQRVAVLAAVVMIIGLMIYSVLI